MPEVCENCGLPKDLCVCETLAKEEQRIKVSIRKRSFGKFVTVIEGLDSKEIDIKSLAKTLKKELACGGTYKNGTIELQGVHKNRIKPILVKSGFSPESIEV